MGKTQSNSNLVFRSMHSQTLITVILGILELIYFSVMSRLLTQQDFGFFALITAVTTVLTSLSDAGLGAAIIQNKNANNKFISTAFSLSIISGFIFCLILFFCAPLFSDMMTGDHSLTLAFRIISIIMLFQGINNIHNAQYIKNFNFFKLGIYRALVYVCSSSVGIFMALNDFGFYSIIGAIITNQFLFTILMLWVNRKEKINFKIYKENVKSILGFGGWLTATVIIRNITEQMDKLIVARLLSVTTVGEINRPNGFVNTISSKINSIFDTILFPILSSVQDNKDSLKSAFEKSTSLVIVFSSFLSGVIVLSSKYIIDIFFGHEWENVTKLLWVFGFSIIFNGISRIQDCFFRSMGIMKAYFIVRLLSCILTIVMIIIGCQFGAIGVAFAILISNFLSFVIKYTVLMRYIGFSTKRFIINIGKNTWLSIFIELLCFIPILYFEPAQYFIIFIYILIIVLTILLFPNAFGELFYEQIIKRYLYPVYKKIGIYK